MSKRVSNRVAAIQMVSGHDIEANLAEAQKLLKEAAAEGASVAVLPENFAVLATSQMIDCGRQEAGPEPVIRAFLAEQARKLGIWIVGGSMPVAKRPDGSEIEDRVRATCLVFDDQGREVARYDKIHLFDVGVPDSAEAYRESATFVAGPPTPHVVDTPIGRLGLSVCYDLRFPELYRAMAAEGAEIVVAPSAFTHTTGSAHWHVLTRARAIENLVTMIAPNQAGHHANGRRTYGHSLIIDPWGQIKAEAQSEANEVIVAPIDRARIASLREGFPCLSHRRLF